MATLPRFTVMREDVSIVYAREHGLTRTSATILQALTIIGSSQRTLVLTEEGDGIWSLTSNVTIPANVTLEVPLGVVVGGTANLLIEGAVIAWRSNWFQSTGTLTITPTGTHALTLANLQARALTLTVPLPVASGGTGATTAATARSNLGVPLPLAIASGGTGATTAAEARVLLGLELGVNAQAQHAKLQSFANLTATASQLPYFTGSNTLGVTTMTPLAQTLLDDATEATMRTTLQLGSLALLNSVSTAQLDTAAVTYAKIQNVTAARLLGNAGVSAAAPAEIALGPKLSFAGGLLDLDSSVLEGSGITGRLATWDSINGLTAAALLYYDATTGWLGLNTTTPEVRLDVNGIVNALRFQVLEVPGDGITGFQSYLNTDTGIARAAIRCNGTAESSFNGHVHIGTGRSLGIGSSIGATFVHNLQLFGAATAGKPGGGSWSDSSSRVRKRNVRNMNDGLQALLQLRGKRFQWDEPEHEAVLPGDQIGFIVEDVEATPFAQWVSTGLNGEKILTIRGFEALAVEAMRDLRQMIQAVAIRVTALEQA